MTSIRITNIVENLDERYGGPAKSIPYACKYLERDGIRTSICSVIMYPDEANDVVAENGLTWWRFPYVGIPKIRYSTGLRNKIRDEVASARASGAVPILHQHTLWNYTSYCAFAASRSTATPLVVSARGALYDWSLAQTRIPKKIAWLVFQERALQGCSCVHVTEPGEHDAVRRLGITAPIALIPNGVPVENVNEVAAAEARRTLGLPAGKRYALFLSRLHKKKGIDLLIRAWSKLATEIPGWTLLIAGPCEDTQYKRYLKDLAGPLVESGEVRFLGMLRAGHRDAALSLSELFVLPSHTENFGIAIAEAMAHRTAVLTTTGTPWREIRDSEAGWWIELTDTNLVASLRIALSSRPEDLARLGRNGRIAVEKYSWSTQAAKLAEVYRWVAGHGDAPPYVAM